jgi:hypothetical protein
LAGLVLAASDELSCAASMKGPELSMSGRGKSRALTWLLAIVEQEIEGEKEGTPGAEKQR